MSSLKEPLSLDTDNLLEDSDHINDNGNKTVTSNKNEMMDLQIAKAKTLSMAFMKSFSGLCCHNCDNDPFKTIGKKYNNNNNHKNIHNVEGTNFNPKEQEQEDTSPTTGVGIGEMLFLKDPSSVLSPSVICSMMIENLDSREPKTIETVIGDYMCFCRFYNVHYNSGILTAIRFSSPSLRPTGSFHDTDMLALVELLLHHGNDALKHISRLDFSIASKEGRHIHNKKLLGFTSHGALSLAKALQTTKYVREVFLPRHRIGPYGASVLFLACRQNKTIEDLNLRRCRIGERGALAFCELILNDMSHKTSKDKTVGRKLFNVNLSANQIGHQGTIAIENLLKERMTDDIEKRCQIFINLDGNLVFPEIMNAVTHCIGVLLSLFGGHLMSQRVRDESLTHVISCYIFTGSLLALYLSSTLFHSFFTMVNTRDVFRVMDKCAIYILIAGSYTPFMQILLSDQPIYSFGLLGFIYICGFLGIAVEALYPKWTWKSTFSLTMYLGMGWACLICLPQMAGKLHDECIFLIFLGGVAYTAGVPFFLRNNNLDHAIWHLFVLSGSLFHWAAIYIYVAPHPLTS